MRNAEKTEPWRCYAKPAALNGKTCFHYNHSGGKQHNGLTVCEECGCTKIASESRKRSEAARLGGLASQESSKVRRWSPEEARAQAPKGSFALLTPEERAEAGRIGGEAAHASGRARKWTKRQAAAAAKKSAEIRRKRA